ncbi:hypothetical protein ACROYT_G003957 [Oculina patagonica]
MNGAITQYLATAPAPKQDSAFYLTITFQILKQRSDPDGRFAIVDIKTNEKILTLINIYAPNKDDPDFIQKVIDLLLDFTCDDIIFGGDFNLVQDLKKDKKGGNPKTHRKAAQRLSEAALNLDLTDIWRDMHPDDNRFTWRQKNPEIHCRLDYFLINQGYWKLNTSLLSEIEYIEWIKSTIAAVQKEYENDNNVDDSLLWEMIKLKVRESSIRYAKKKKTLLKNQEAKLENEITQLTKVLESENTWSHEKSKASHQNKLTAEESHSCEGLLIEKECLEALQKMKNDKSPGNDGLPSEFYKVFWKDISTAFIKAINRSYSCGKLSISQRRGTIKLIPKKNSILSKLKNRRPLTLLNTDYKIASKAIANRLKTALPKVISYDQTGFLKGRSINENIRLIEGIIRYTETEQIPGLLLFVDFEKAFDTLEWSFVKRTFQFYNFGPSLIKWIELFYKDIQSNVLNNGWASEFFSLGRGVRQGCPLSPYIFILCAEILANAMRNNKDIKGILVEDTEVKISQYADETTLILNGTKKSLEASLLMLDAFYNISGFKDE